jgi:hypothetical protein
MKKTIAILNCMPASTAKIHAIWLRVLRIGGGALRP